ncbi:VanZ family protein [Hydrogenophaga aromaticivorans]|uniref:VanZ family protein n=1 Tax=Hydrogenophaga aromaticivorans TaxID=2610898 RepID=UPI0031EE0CC1
MASLLKTPRTQKLIQLLGIWMVVYTIALSPSARILYMHWDKLAHALAFIGVYGSLVWALRWRPLALATLTLALGATVEVHQYFLPGFSASLKDWLADAVGIALACGAHLAWRKWCSPAEAEAPGGFLPRAQFQRAVAALPLVSVDWVLTNPAGELLVGQRLNAPARGTWFTPGGRVRKGEALAVAQQRVALEELGLPVANSATWLERARLMGAWDHFFSDAAFSASMPTQYVNLPHWLALSAAEVAQLRLPVGEQHGHWQWMPLDQAAEAVHEYVKPYVAWLQARRS